MIDSRVLSEEESSSLQAVLSLLLATEISVFFDGMMLLKQRGMHPLVSLFRKFITVWQKEMKFWKVTRDNRGSFGRMVVSIRLEMSLSSFSLIKKLLGIFT